MQLYHVILGDRKHFTQSIYGHESPRERELSYTSEPIIHLTLKKKTLK